MIYPHGYDRSELQQYIVKYVLLLPDGYPVTQETYDAYLIDEMEILLEMRELCDKIMGFDRWGCGHYHEVEHMISLEQHFHHFYKQRQKKLSVIESHKILEPIQLWIPQLIPHPW